MGAVIFILVLFIVFVGGGWFIGRAIGGLFESKNTNDITYEKSTYVDNSVHYHTHQTLNVTDKEGLKSFKKETSSETNF